MVLPGTGGTVGYTTPGYLGTLYPAGLWDTVRRRVRARGGVLRSTGGADRYCKVP